MGARKLFIRTCHPVVPAVVLHEEGGVGKTYAGVFASQQRRTQGSVEVLYAVGAVERENFIQPIQVLPSWAYMGTATGSLRHPSRCARAGCCFLKQPLIEKRLPCGRLERAKRSQRRPEKKASTNCKAQLHTWTTLDARERHRGATACS